MRAVAIVLGAMACSVPGLATAAPSAETIARNCIVCHGSKEIGQLEIPKLTNYPAPKMTEMLTGFREGQKKATIMNRIAKAFNDEQIAALAAHFAKQ